MLCSRMSNLHEFGDKTPKVKVLLLLFIALNCWICSVSWIVLAIMCGQLCEHKDCVFAP